MAEGLEKLQQATADTVQAIVIEGTRAEAEAHSIRVQVERVVRAKPNGLIHQIKDWAAKTALQIEDLAELANARLGELIAVSKEKLRELRQERIEQDAADLEPPPGPDQKVVADMRFLIEKGHLVRNVEGITRRLIALCGYSAPAAREIAIAACA